MLPQEPHSSTTGMADLTVTYSPDHFNYTTTRGGPVMLDPGSATIRAGITTDARKPVSVRVGFSTRTGFDDSGDDLSFDARLSLKPSDQLDLSFAPRIGKQTVMDQYVTSTSTLPFDPTYGRRYLFGVLERRSVSMQARIDWTFTPSLSFQLFAQPLLSSGDYMDYKQLIAPRSYDFDSFEEGVFSSIDGTVSCIGGRLCAEVRDDGKITQHVDFDGDGEADYSFSDRDFNVRSLVGNAVLRWEYLPGSTIFLVWQRRQSESIQVGDFDFDRDLGALLDAPADDRFMIKVNYWLGM